MIVLGIDPGQTGGLALVDGTLNCKLVDAIPMPLTTKEWTKKPTIFMAVAEVWFGKAIGRFSIDLGVVENVHAMPMQGVSSSFQFGRMFGAAEMLIQDWCMDRKYVTPQAWKKHFGLKADKLSSVALATDLYGDEHWKLKKHEGVAEAALIATWGLHQITKE